MERAPLRQIERAPGRVVERRHQVDEPHAGPLQHSFELVQVDAVLVERHLDHLQAVRAQQPVHLVVRRRRQHHRVTRCAERAQREVERLPYVVGLEEKRLRATTGQVAYVRGADFAPGTKVTISRPTYSQRSRERPPRKSTVPRTGSS